MVRASQHNTLGLADGSPGMDQSVVTVVIVVRNGARDILGALDTLREQDYRPLEILVADGLSDDGTRALVADYTRRYPDLPLRLLDNPGRIQASGWNVGIRNASGNYVLRLDAVHCRLRPDYIRQCLQTLVQLRQADPAVAAVGGKRLSAPATGSAWSQAIAVAQSSRFGVGNAAYRLSEKPGFADTLGVPLYERQALLQVGPFDESLGRSEDNEFHARMRAQGLKLYFLPQAVAVYYPRDTLAGLASQMFHNGWWISATVMRTRSFPFGVRHVVPFAFYLALALLAVLSFALTPARWLLLALLAAYILGSLAAALLSSPSLRFWRVLAIYWLMHACYAAGTLAGLFAARDNLPIGQRTAPGANPGS